MLTQLDLDRMPPERLTALCQQVAPALYPHAKMARSILSAAVLSAQLGEQRGG